MLGLRLRGIYLLFTSLFQCCLLFAQPVMDIPFNAEWFRTRDGLPHNTITTVYQDRSGYLWIGTYNGLCRYDGYEFSLFQAELDPTGLNAPHALEVIYEDRSGVIWIGTRAGVISCYDSLSNTWRSFHSDVPIHTSIRCFYEDRSGKMWVGTRDGYLGSLNMETGFIRYEKLDLHGVYGIIPFPDAELLLVGLQLKRYSLKDKTETFYSEHKNLYIMNNEIFVEGGKVSVLVDFGFYVMAPDKPDIKVNVPARTATRLGGSYYHDRFLLYSPQGLNIYDLNGRLLDSFAFPGLEAYLSKLEVNEVFLDRDNILWLATNSGLLKIDREKFRFENVTSREGKSNNYVRGIYETEEGIWVGVRKGEATLIEKGRSNKVLEKTKFIDVFGIPFSEPTVNCFLETKGGDLYAGCLEGIAKYNPRTKELPILRPGGADFNFIEFQEIWSLFEDEDGNIWIGTNKSGLLILDPDTDTLIRIPEFPNSAVGENRFSVWSIVQDHRGKIWLGTNNGLYVYEKGKNGIRSNCFKSQKGFGSSTIKGNHVWNIFEDSRRELWIGTSDEGVNVVNASRTGIRYLNIETGMPNNVVSSIVEDAFGSVWLGTMNGMMKVNSNGTWDIYTEDDGLVSNDFNFKAACRDENGRMYFGTKLGIISFDPALFREKKQAGYAPVISEFTVLGKDWMRSVLENEVIELEHGQNFFQFRFSLLHYRNSLNQAFRYRLEGFETHWNLATAKSPYARYTQVPPGKYVLRVESSSDGVHWHTTGLSKQIHIKPALWQRAWFWVGLALLLILIIAGVIRWRFLTVLDREKERTHFIRQLSELELQALQAQMNPHFIFNSINSIQHYVLNNDEVAANDYLTNFARLMRLFLQSSKHKYITLKDELEILGNYIKMETLRFEEKFTHSIEIGEGVPLHVKIPTMILQPFVENSINHGLLAKKEKGSLHIRFTREGNSLCCVIDDDGIGREKATLNRKSLKEHHSMGMGLITERLKIYEAMEEMKVNVTITDKVSDTNEPRGTRVDICIPINNWSNEGSNH